MKTIFYVTVLSKTLQARESMTIEAQTTPRQGERVMMPKYGSCKVLHVIHNWEREPRNPNAISLIVVQE